MNPRQLLQRVLKNPANVRFAHFMGLVKAFGFEPTRVSVSHHIFTHPDIPELINIQEYKGQVKPYQIRQFLRLVERYNLRLEDRE